MHLVAGGWLGLSNLVRGDETAPNPGASGARWPSEGEEAEGFPAPWVTGSELDGDQWAPRNTQKVIPSVNGRG